MATNINIRRDVKDPFYRYKMPLLQSKVEGKGNGIKTVLPNVSEVARALSRPAAYPTKYFGNELGAQTTMDIKNDRFIVNGAHAADKLQDLLDGFIERFVLCGNCKSPETDLVITRDQMILRRCMACGQTSNVDMRHKLTAFILKSPPPKEKKGGKHASSGDAQEGGAGGSNASGDDVDAIAQETAGLELNSDDDDGSDWDYDEEAVGVSLAPGGVFAEGDSEAEKDPFDELGDFISEGAPTDDEIFAKAQELDLHRNHRTLVVVTQCLFDGSTTLVRDIAKHQALLTRFGRSEKHQRAVVGGFERVIEADLDGMVSKTPAVLMALYEKDVLSEELLADWGRKPSKKYVGKDAAKRIHKAAQPFLEWLTTAESESDGDSD